MNYQSLGLFALVFLGCMGCREEKVSRPLPDFDSDTLTVPLRELYFEANGTKWEGYLLSFTQPVPLEIHYTKSGFYLSQRNNSGLNEGPARVCLRSGGRSFFYPVWLKNKTRGREQVVDFRSPKTVNTDSSLHHQKILLAMDSWSNLLPVTDDRFFEEKQVYLSPVKGTYRAQKDNPLSAFYVQPGSCTKIPVKATFQRESGLYKVLAGPLKDRYENILADGTLVTFYYGDGTNTHLMEAALLNGRAIVELPVVPLRKYRLFARVNTTFSKTMVLNPI